MDEQTDDRDMRGQAGAADSDISEEQLAQNQHALDPQESFGQGPDASTSGAYVDDQGEGMNPEASNAGSP